MSLAWPGAQVTVRFTGQSLGVRLSDAFHPDETPDSDRVLVTVDEHEPFVIVLQQGVAFYPLARGLGAKRAHVVRIWKQSEAEVGTVRVLGFETDGAPSPSVELAAGRGVLEAVGDSITVGYGNMGSSPVCENHVPLTDSSKAYAALAAHDLGLDYRAVAYSGKGLIHNYEPDDHDALPALYGRALPFEPFAVDSTTTRAADVVVLNIGTNDGVRGMPDQASYEHSLRAFIAQIRRRNPTAWLILSLGPMLADDAALSSPRASLRAWFTETRERLRAEGDSRVELVEFRAGPTDNDGCDYHPNAATHVRMARELAVLVRRLMGS